MKATFEVSIIIDGNKVQTAMGLQKGFEGMNPDDFQKVQSAITQLDSSLKKQFARATA